MTLLSLVLLVSAAGAEPVVPVFYDPAAIAGRLAEIRAASAPVDEDAQLKAALDAMAAVPGRSGTAVSPALADVLTSPRVYISFRNEGDTVGYGYARPVGGPSYWLISLNRSLLNPDPAVGMANLSMQLTDAASRILEIDFPDSAEREHMRISRKLRVWIELNEEPGQQDWSRLDVLAKKDPAVAGYVQFWLDRCGPFASKECDMEQAAERLGKPSLTKTLELTKKVQDELAKRIAKQQAAGGDVAVYVDALQMAKEREKELTASKKSFDAFRKAEGLWGH